MSTKQMSVAVYSNYKGNSIPRIAFCGTQEQCQAFLQECCSGGRGIMMGSNEAYIDGEFTAKISRKTGIVGIAVGFGDHWLAETSSEKGVE